VANNDAKQENPTNPYWKYVVSKMGQVAVDKPGKYTLTLAPQTIENKQKLGLTMVEIKLIPVQKSPP